MPNDRIAQLTGALKDLLLAQNAEGERVLYSEHREPVRNMVVVELCRVCGEVDDHKDGCAVGIAERVLRQVERAESES